MLLNLFSKAPLLEQESSQWLRQSFNWCMNQFDSHYFYQKTMLVLPSNRFFPGRVDSHQGMAELIFERVQDYAGMKHWPFAVLPPNACATDTPQQILISGNARGVTEPAPANAQRLPVYYDPRHVNNPEAMIANYAHTLAHYLVSTAKKAPPGEAEHFPYATEVLAIFMGFGVMFANSAFTHQVGCGGCQKVGRAAFLSEDEATYTLAIFCVLKKIPANTVTPHLKKHLRGFFKRAMKEISVDNAQ